MKDKTTGGSRTHKGTSAIYSEDLDDELVGAYITSDNVKKGKEIRDYTTSQPTSEVKPSEGRWVDGKGLVRNEDNAQLLLRMRERYHDHPISPAMPDLMVDDINAHQPEKALSKYQREFGKVNKNPYDDLPDTQRIRAYGKEMCAMEARQIWNNNNASDKQIDILLAGHREAKAQQQANLVDSTRSTSSLNTALVSQYLNLTNEQLEAIVYAQEQAIITLLMPKIERVVAQMIKEAQHG
ncbi:MAG: hypothetical protein NHB32_14040 [Fischerella sp. CENA71]|nr:hypothetical protein [Fischerella sp. CENA71]